MKTKKIASGFYNIFHNNQKFECIYTQTSYGWEWVLALVQVNKNLIRVEDDTYPHGFRVELSDIDTFETTEWVATEPTLRDCKEIVLRNFSE